MIGAWLSGVDPIVIGLCFTTAAGIVCGGLLLRSALECSQGEFDAVTRAETAAIRHATAMTEQRQRQAIAERVIRTLQVELREQREIARVAADTGEALVHEHARLITALQEACAFLAGGYDERERIAGLHRLDLAALGHGAAAAALVGQWLALIAECEAATQIDPLPPAPPLDQRHLRVVGGTAARPAAEPHHLTPHSPIGA